MKANTNESKAKFILDIMQHYPQLENRWYEKDELASVLRNMKNPLTDVSLDEMEIKNISNTATTVAGEEESKLFHQRHSLARRLSKSKHHATFVLYNELQSISLDKVNGELFLNMKNTQFKFNVIIS